VEDFVMPPEMIAKYIVRRRQDMLLIEAALQAKNLEPIGRIAHQIKGNATSYGLQELAQVATALDLAAKSGDWTQLTQVALKMRELVASY
jgi:HPt (histidine-containing phosphotransfer) domain-containing protein